MAAESGSLCRRGTRRHRLDVSGLAAPAPPLEDDATAPHRQSAGRAAIPDGLTLEIFAMAETGGICEVTVHRSPLGV
jgi:hypothetical protein